jgi:aminoglycoside phosphotransferase family enzyme/predicted kinase
VSETILAALADPATYDFEGAVTRHETHASWVFVAGDHAYKLKKPVRLAFLDYSTPELRREACREEVRVNAELAPDVYLNVLAVVPAQDGLRLAPVDASGAVDYVVHMRRFDERETLAGAVVAGGPDDADLTAVAVRLARFHEAARVAKAGGAAATLARWRADIDELAALVDPVAWRLHEASRFAAAFVARHAAELDRRAREGLVRDGHGDLRCEHVVLTDPVTVVDRIEFDPALRQIDVGCDLAFLLMDLEALGRPRAAELLLAEYRRAGGSPGSDELVCFHSARWAFVRAKVAVIARSEGLGGAAPDRRAGVLRELGERLCWRARGRLVAVVAGVPASGKSTLAHALAQRTGLPVVSSDVMRKGLAGLAPSERATEEHYSDAFTRRTYRALGTAARSLVDTGSGVIVDGTFARQARRDLLHRALAGTDAGVLFIECRVTRDTAMARARARQRQASRISDATAEVAARLYDWYEPPDEREGAGLLTLDAEQPLERQLELVSEAADRMLSNADGEASPLAPAT